jgi:hypothetical protein
MIMKDCTNFILIIFVSALYVYSAESSFHLTGSIGKSNIQMYLCIDSNSTISGAYFYAKYWSNIGIKGTYAEKTKKITISEDVSSGIMELTTPDGNGNIKGTWIGNAKRLPVNLTIAATYRIIEFDTLEWGEDESDRYEYYYNYPELADRFPYAKELNSRLRAIVTGLPDSFELKYKPATKSEHIDYDNDPAVVTSESQIGKIRYIDDNLLILKRAGDYNQEGAAHPTSESWTENYEIHGGKLKLITLQDIIKDSCAIDTIVGMLYSETDSDYGTDSIFKRKNFEAWSDFYFTQKGCVFPYRICHAFGIEDTLQWFSLRRFLKKDSPLSHIFSKW